jgi:hypothetical protein
MKEHIEIIANPAPSISFLASILDIILFDPFR